MFYFVSRPTDFITDTDKSFIVLIQLVVYDQNNDGTDEVTHNGMIIMHTQRLQYAHYNSKMCLFYYHLPAHRFNIIFSTFTPCQVYYFLWKKKLFIYFYCSNNKVLHCIYMGSPDKTCTRTINSMQRPLFASCLLLTEGLYMNNSITSCFVPFSYRCNNLFIFFMSSQC